MLPEDNYRCNSIPPSALAQLSHNTLFSNLLPAQGKKKRQIHDGLQDINYFAS
jgi:hypothetical protein